MLTVCGGGVGKPPPPHGQGLPAPWVCPPAGTAVALFQCQCGVNGSLKRDSADHG